jgi:glucokinase
MTLGLDVGGTYLRSELRFGDKTLKTSSIKSLQVELKKYIEDILEQEAEIKNICISFAGQVKDGVIISSPNIKVENFDIKEYFKKNIA